MPNTPTRQPNQQEIQKANLLLNLLAQLAQPTHSLLVALPDGKVLAANAVALASKTFQANNNATVYLRDWLDMPEEEYTSLIKKLQEDKNVSGDLKLPENSSCHLHKYSCRLVQFQESTFICTETFKVGQPSTLVPFNTSSYHSVFENSTEPLFILNCNGDFIDINQSALALVNQPKQQLINKSIYRSFNLNLFERITLRNQIKQVLSGNPQKFEWWLQEKDQNLLPIEVSLQKGTFLGKDVIFGSAKNLFEVIGTEQEILFRNHQLEFVNQLITNLPSFDNQESVLKYTLEELLQKSSITQGCVYNYLKSEDKLSLLYSVGTTSQAQLLQDIEINPEIIAKLFTSDKQKTLGSLTKYFQKHLSKQYIVVPVTTTHDLLAFILIDAENKTKISRSLLALLDFVGTDIGNYIERHQLQQKLSLSEDKYKLLFEASYDAILLFKDGIVVDCNTKATEFFGCTREDLIGHSPSDYSPEFQPDGMRSDEKTALLMENLLRTGTPVTFEWKNKKKDGTLFDAELSINRLIIDGETYVLAFKRDITHQKAIQLASRRDEIVRESMKHFHDFLEKVNLIYYSLDTQGNIVYANDYFLKYVEYSREELIGKNFYDTLVPEKERERRKKNFFDKIRNKHLKSYYERDFLTKSGQLKTVRWNSMLEYNAEGEVTGLTNVGKDMTDKRIAMDALKDNKIRLQDIFDNAHDLIQNTSLDNKFIFVNKAWKDRLGYDDFDIENLSLNDIVHPYYKAKLIYQLRNLYKGENVNKIETVFLTKSGKPVHLIGSITCTIQDGRPVATRAILHDITDRIKAERLQKVYYSIANLAISSKDLNSLYSAIHRELSKIIETRNIYIALCDNDHKHLNFVYLIDQFVDKTTKTNVIRPFSTGLSEYIIETGKPLYMQKKELKELSKKEGFVIRGAMPEVMLSSPLAIGDRIIGAITLQDYQNPDAYVHTDIEILHFISNQVALAIERKRNEEQINNQNARLNAIFESGTHQMWSFNRKLEITSFNRNFNNAIRKVTGQDLTLYSSFKDLIFTENDKLEPQFKEIANVFIDKSSQALTGVPQHFELYIKNPERWREIYLNPIYLEDGTFEEVSGIALDITDKKRSQLDLAESEEKFRQIFESFQDIYYRTSLDGYFEMISPSVQQWLGYRAEDIIGKKAENFYVNPQDRELLRQRVLAEQSVRDFETQVICKDGTHKTVTLDSRLVLNERGRPIGLEGVIRDVSELKRTQLALLKAKEEAENLLEVKTQFLANMSHELRTPMNGIIGMIDLLNQINTDPEQGEYIDTLRKSSDALLAILNDILDLSKMQAGKLVIHENNVDLYEALDKIYSLFANRAQHKDLSFSYHIAPETPQFVFTDETRLLQILSNLTSNAIKFTDAGEVSIHVSCTRLNNDECKLHIRVKDSGRGIKPEEQQLLFTNFTQLDNSSTKTFAGTGLGLAISKQIAHLLHGDIGVESVPGEGSTFWFEILVRIATPFEIESQRQKQEQQIEEVEYLTNHPYILLVDDNQINQKVAQKLLERLGCIVEIASNGYEAIELATKSTYNIIFMDIQMPGMDGVTATGHIKEILGEDCPPIIAMTAYSMKDDALKFMNQGMDDYISKPVRGKDLYTIISKWEANGWQKQNIKTFTEETQAEEESQPIIDESVVEQLRQVGGNEFAIQLYTEFEEEAAELLETAKKDIELLDGSKNEQQAQHYKSILSTLHQLKGTGFTLGLNLLAELAKQLEHDIKQDNLEHVNYNFSKLLEQYENYRKSYKDIII